MSKPPRAVIEGALEDAEATLRRRLSTGAAKVVERQGPRAVERRAAAFREVAAGKAGGRLHRQLLEGPAAVRMPPPRGSAITPLEQAAEVRSALAAQVTKSLSTSSDAPGKTWLDRLSERFGMAADDVARMLEDFKILPKDAAPNVRQGQLSSVSGRVFEGRLVEHNPATRQLERAAAEAVIRDRLGDPTFTLGAGMRPELPASRRVGPRRVQAMFEQLEDVGIERAAPGIWIMRRGAAVDAKGELTDGLTLVVDLRTPTPHVEIVGIRESKLESVVGALKEQVPQDFKRVIDMLEVDGRPLQDATIALSSTRLVVSLLTEKRRLSDAGVARIKEAYRRAAGSSKPLAIVHVDGTADARLAREIAARALEGSGGRFRDLVKKK